jgi:hypothetical protein
VSHSAWAHAPRGRSSASIRHAQVYPLVSAAPTADASTRQVLPINACCSLGGTAPLRSPGTSKTLFLFIRSFLDRFQVSRPLPRGWAGILVVVDTSMIDVFLFGWFSSVLFAPAIVREFAELLYFCGIVVLLWNCFILSHSW